MPKPTPPRDNAAGAPRSPVLLVGHGTRDPQGQAELRQTAELLQELLPQTVVEPSFLELAAPTIKSAVNKIVESTTNTSGSPPERMLVAPLLLFSAGHAQRDVPNAVEDACRHLATGLEFDQAEHLGCEQSLLRLSALRYETAMQDRPEVAPENTLLIMVGRGSRDAQASDEMREFTGQRVELTPVGHHKTCFVAMAEPRFDASLQHVAEQLRWGPLAGIRRIVVQPHLLFQGELLKRIRHRVISHAAGKPAVDQMVESEQASSDAPAASAHDARGVEWIVTSHLGCHALLAEAILARVQVAAKHQ